MVVTCSACGARYSAAIGYCRECLFAEDDALPWIDGWVPSHLVIPLARSPLTGPDELANWLAAGFTIDEAMEWAERFPRDWDDRERYDTPSGMLISIDDLATWKACGFNSRTAATWMECFRSAKEAQQWRLKSVPPYKAADLREQGISPAEAATVLQREERRRRGTPPGKGIGHLAGLRHLSGPMCGFNKHEQCDDPRGCSCSCHCWHDGRSDDWEQQNANVGLNQPHFVLGTQRSRACLDLLHEACLYGKRCRCSCHCFHHDL